MVGEDSEGERFAWTRRALDITATANLLFLASVIATVAFSAIFNTISSSMPADSSPGTALPICCLFCFPPFLLPVAAIMMLMSAREMERGRWMAWAGGLSLPASFAAVAIGSAGIALVAAYLSDSVSLAIVLSMLLIMPGFVIYQLGLTIFAWRFVPSVGKVAMLLLDFVCLAISSAVAFGVAVFAVFTGGLATLVADATHDPSADAFGVLFGWLLIFLFAALAIVLFVTMLTLHSAFQGAKALMVRYWLRGLEGSV